MSGLMGRRGLEWMRGRVDWDAHWEKLAFVN